tara:strand:+ start:25 stop:585 length:561 start_codon:yes stop_codon:yes gene_type:complete
MKQLFFILLLCLGLTASSQCVSNQSATLTPAGPYQPGDIVVVNYTLGNWTQLNVNWIHAFQINLGPGWVNLIPITTPGNPGGSVGNWIWDLQNTFISGLNFGPGWRFTNTFNTNWGTSSMGPFTMSFQIRVASTCTADDLSISMSVIGDCLTGGWSNGACCSDSAYNIYNGVVQITPIITSNINHF